MKYFFLLLASASSIYTMDNGIKDVWLDKKINSIVAWHRKDNGNGNIAETTVVKNLDKGNFFIYSSLKISGYFVNCRDNSYIINKLKCKIATFESEMNKK